VILPELKVYGSVWSLCGRIEDWKTYQNSAIDGLRYFLLACRAAFEIHPLKTQAPTRVSRRWPSESRRTLGDPGINLVASRDFPWHESKKADGEVEYAVVDIRTRRSRARRSGNFQKSSEVHPSHGRPHFDQQHRTCICLSFIWGTTPNPMRCSPINLVSTKNMPDRSPGRVSYQPAICRRDGRG
jgi:hypothetical protein